MTAFHTILSKIKWLGAFLVLSAAVYSIEILAQTPAQDTLDIVTAQETHHFIIETPRTRKDKERGLMYRTSLAADHGMLFYWKKPYIVGMWMKNTLIPLDMVFIDEDGKIVYIAANTKPNSTDNINAGRSVSAVLELAGGVTAADHINVGDKVIHADFQKH